MDASRATELTQELQDTDFLSELGYQVDEDMEIEDVREDVETRVREYEVIYYASAMELLSENDPSLSASLGYASEMGFEVENLSSEILATLFMQGSMMDELSEINFD